MKDTTQLEIKKPLAWYNRKIKIDFKKLFTALAKSAILTGAVDYKGGLKEFVDVINAFDFKSDPGGLAYRLIINAMVNAAHNLAAENRDRFKPEYQEQEKLYDHQDYVQFLDDLNGVLEGKELYLNNEVLKNPKNLTFVTDFCYSFEKWLQFFGLDSTSAQNITNRLPAYFVLALNDEWKSRPGDYNLILQKIETPFTPAAKRELEWQRYNSFLEKQVEESVFGETFSLKQIYVPLRAYYTEKNNQTDSSEQKGQIESYESAKKRIPFMLTDELYKWLDISESKYCLKFISGGPGSGKSSIAKMWCAELAQKNKIKVLFIPLQLFDVQSDIEDAISKFVSRNPETQFSFNPLDFQNGGEKTLIVFDGLDELSQQGKYAAEMANNFVVALDAYSKQINRDSKIQALFLISGREMSIQSNTVQFRSEQYIFHLLPYYIDSIEFKSMYNKEHIDFLSIDQRNDWWIQFGKLKDLDYSKLPEELNIKRLKEITAQPLLNYLVALSLLRGKIQFSSDINLNEIYRDLIEGVHERAYEKHKFKPIEGLSLDDFSRILEEIGVSAWHGGDVRTTSIKRIEQHIIKNGLKNLLDKFEKEAEKGIIRLLTAFYFRQHGISDGDKTFEFTHKSFGEYLTAVRLVKLVERVSEEMDFKIKQYDRGWSEEEALKKWMEVTGPSPIDNYLFEFILDEIKGINIETLKQYQANLAKLLSWSIRFGMPMLDPRQSHKEEIKLTRNSSEAILALHSACGRITLEVSEIQTNTLYEFGEWFSSLQTQRKGGENVLGFSCLTNLCLNNYVLYNRDFYEATFTNSTLTSSDLVFASLAGANLRKVNLQRAILNQTHLQRANLQDANLQDANLQNANLQDANLQGAKLQGANLQGANLQGANLQGANLQGANLQDAKYVLRDLKKAILTNPVLKNPKT